MKFMMPFRGLSVLVLWLLLAACSDADDNDCPIHIDAPVDAFAFPDAPPIDAPLVDAPPVDAPVDAVFDTLPEIDAAIDAPVDAAVDAAIDAAIDAPAISPADVGEMYRAVRELTLLQGRLDRYLVNGEFPTLAVPFTPGATCCGPGGMMRCPVNPAAWQGTAWSQLEFEMTSEHAHVYSIQSSSAGLVAVARADLDCDGTPTDIILICNRSGGQTYCSMTWPSVID